MLAALNGIPDAASTVLRQNFKNNFARLPARKKRRILSGVS